MASLSTRRDLLERTVASLLPQVDALCVYLNGYKKVPTFLHNPKVVHAVLSNDAGWRGAEAKLWFWDRAEFKAAPYWEDDDIAIVVDDDIIYPRDYVASHVAALARHPGAITCVHGSVMMETFERYADSRYVARARSGMATDAQVHIPGTGTMAFRRGDFNISLRNDVRWSHCVDVMTAIAAKRQKVECWTIARPEKWLQPMMLPLSGGGVFKSRVGVRNDQAETTILQKAGPWPKLEIVEGLLPRNTTKCLR